jgi:hypothetical protein
MYTPPEFISVDEAEKGRRVRRDGLERTKFDFCTFQGAKN